MAEDFRTLLEGIKNNKNIAIIAHQSPDADAFGSAVALREILRKFYSTLPNGKRAKQKIDVFMECDTLPTSLKIFVPNKENSFKFFNPTAQKHYDLAISLDCANVERMGKYVSIFQNADKTMCIDHHETNTHFAMNNYVLRTSSTCEALYFLLLHRRNFEVPKYILSLLYSGIITDTNNLKINADSLSTDKAMAYLKQNLGRSLMQKIRGNFFESNSAAKDELRASAYSKANRKYFEDGKVCVIALNNKIFTKANAEMEDAEGIVDEALYRKGVLVSAIILEKNKNDLYVKLRGKTGVDVSSLAKEFGGGGHERQAAFQFKGKINTLERLLIAKSIEFVKNLNETSIEDYTELFH